ncbi:MFS transporter [Streptacidiphilus jiangxiensis]|uniref:Sugar phosphate permease n=1 Tax=Streptacidiphilus jiangxiensis TaxID=235985 RepID=A0A1H7JLH2_STRJI|nr:MFS transporter [Streptacidiphilus jiangxiensis]SEK74707.1 Sugar phosphate permease [Streptacidiphilus jiangxiensis]
MTVDPATSASSEPAVAPAPARREPPGGRGAWTAWGIGVTVYVLAVIHRTSLGVAGVDAAARFGINASALSTFSILQVLVYAGMQVPVGLLVDRHGPRRILSAGLVLLTAGQLGFALASSFTPALLARGVLGCGDAMTFVSVLRIGSRWFPLFRNPFIAQLTGLVGTIGNLVSTMVLAQVLHSAGWTATFGTTALLGFAVLALVVLVLRETPDSAPREPLLVRRRARVPDAPPPAAGFALRDQIRAAWREPGTRLGMWVHFTTAFPASSFLLLWGMPFLMSGQGLSRAVSGGLLSLVIVAGMGFAVLFGQLMSRRPSWRTPTVFTVVLGTGAVWALVLTWPQPGHVPMWLLVVLAVAMGSNGPASLIGLDYARPVNPPERIGTASGIVNMGGFIAAVLALFLIGLVLDLNTPGGGTDYSASGFRAAFATLYLPMAVGLLQILRLRRRALTREREVIGATVPKARAAR